MELNNNMNSMAFKGKTAKTKKGNEYKKATAFKTIGTVGGLVGGVALSRTPIAQVGALELATKLAKTPNKLFLATSGIIVAGIAAITLASRAMGAIPDAIINHCRKHKADKADKA